MRCPGRSSTEHHSPTTSPHPEARPCPERSDPTAVFARHQPAPCPSSLCFFPATAAVAQLPMDKSKRQALEQASGPVTARSGLPASQVDPGVSWELLARLLPLAAVTAPPQLHLRAQGAHNTEPPHSSARLFVGNVMQAISSS